MVFRLPLYLNLPSYILVLLVVLSYKGLVHPCLFPIKCPSEIISPPIGLAAGNIIVPTDPDDRGESFLKYAAL